MIDQVKKFVEENREAFDHLEPSAHVLEALQNRLKNKTLLEQPRVEIVEKKTVPLYKKAVWLVAASILLALSTTYILYHQEIKPVGFDQQLANQRRPKAAAENPSGKNSDQTNRAETVQLQKTVVSTRSHQLKKVDVFLKSTRREAPAERWTKDLYAHLRDSSSASVRLSAILEIDRSHLMHKETLDSLAKTMNNDSNSNVRLAALNVIGQYEGNEYATSLLVKSFSTQDDPIVQLGLVSLLREIENVKIEHRLFALVEDPNTFAAVKDEAYTVLLSQNKL